MTPEERKRKAEDSGFDVGEFVSNVVDLTGDLLSAAATKAGNCASAIGEVCGNVVEGMFDGLANGDLFDDDF